MITTKMRVTVGALALTGVLLVGGSPAAGEPQEVTA